ncbi:HAD-IIIC family phosphatase [Nocardia brasiliensis]|uniref:HAD-IIIC family phosphatase n=1 Tax=Nocardia brasiliensis TaxID=37326 RepID=UPI00366C5486
MTTVDQSPLARLRELGAAGRLAEDHATVVQLLAQIAAGAAGLADLTRAGQILARRDPEEMLRRAADSGETVRPITVAVTGHSTIEPLVAPLTAEFARHGYLLRPSVGEFDAYLRDLQDPSSHLYGPDTELALIVLDPQMIFDELPKPWSVADVEQAITAKMAQLDRLIGNYVRHAEATLVLNTVPLHRIHTHSLVDLRSRTRLSVAWRSFNTALLGLSEKYARVQVIDLDPLIAEGGPVHDQRMAVYAKVQLGDEVLSRYAREVGHLIRALHGRTKKVLVVDLDNTLWDGILGDDGADGIAAAITFRGEAFGLFQRMIQQLGSQGVVLAISSKNDREPVLAVLRDHPDMVLRDTDFARINANWEPKDTNLTDIAERLNLGVDSFVFADDSSFETGLVAMSLPNVAVVCLDDEPALHVSKLLADGWFDVLDLTDEDRARGELYRGEAARTDLLAGADSMAEYLRQLGVRVEMKLVEQPDVARVAQLTLRTNQFNLTTQRWQQADVTDRVNDPDHLVLSIRSADRFGDNGVVGALFARRDDGELHIENMVLSCRVFARGIEDAVMGTLLTYARDSGLRAVHGRYLPTAKNGKVREFYPAQGFDTVAEGAGGELTFRHDLRTIPAIPDHVRITSNFLDRVEGRLA